MVNISRRHFLPLALTVCAPGCGRAVTPSKLRSFNVGPDLTKLRLFWKNAAGQNFGTLAAVHAHLKSQGATPLVLMNAGIFGLDAAPVGLHVEEGQELAISLVEMNLYDFALAFRDELQCPDALYLDGTISQAWAAGDDLANLKPQGFGGILAVVA